MTVPLWTDPALHLQPAWCRVTLASIGDAVITTDTTGGLTFLNSAAESLTGWPLREALGQPLENVFRIVHEDTRQPVESPGVRALREGVVAGLANHCLLIRKDGTERPIDDRAAPIRDDQGQVAGVVLVFRDISERRRQELRAEKLALSEARYRRLFETARDGILILAADTGKIIDANPFLSELLGYPRDDFLGKELWEIGLFADRSANEGAFRKLQQDGHIRYDHLPLATRDGQRLDVELVSNVYTGDGQRPVAQCNIRDITERRRLEEQAKQQAAELSDLHRRKDEFLAMMSHEIRNPLAPIMNAVQLLRLQKNESPLQQRACAVIERQVSQLALLVDDLLELSHITTGRILLREEQVDIEGIVEHAVETAQPLIGQHGHTLSVSLPPEPIWLYADAARLEQVVVNLLNNAAKYTEEGGHIWVDVQREGDTVALRVKDTGVGIAPELLPHIFDLFKQAARSLSRSQGGLGIGLCLVQRLVELHRGTVAVHSVPGEGSEFVVRLPVMRTTAPEPPSPAEEISERSGQSLRVLVVDDNVDAAESMAMLVRALGHDVRTAYDGPATLETAATYRPHVVLLDIGLPEMTGYDVAQRIRRGPDLRDVMLVAMTGYGQETDRQRSQAAGFDHHLVKPADFKRVQHILATAAENLP